MIKVKKIRENAILPTRATPGSVGADLYACLDEEKLIYPGCIGKIPLGFSAQIPEGYAGLIFARSGLATQYGIAPANKVGVIDPDYRGEWMVALYNHSEFIYHVNHGDRIAQLVIVPCLIDDFIRVDELSETDRGTGGFGSTGK